ncbi:MAG: PhoH family protein [Candidatus Pacebacteria bacterium]|nr:PhoH family protein [Candidatus Paceibacterota bacterium]
MLKSDAITTAVLLDTNVLLSDSGSLEHFSKNNVVFLALQVLLELDKLKNDPEIGSTASQVSRIIENLQLTKENFFIVKELKKDAFKNFYDPQNNDHKILAALAFLLNLKKRHQIKSDYSSSLTKVNKIKLISQDRNLRIIARELFSSYSDLLEIEDYKRSVAKVSEIVSEKLRIIKDPGGIISQGGENYFPYKEKVFGKLFENQGILCSASGDKDSLDCFGLIRQGDKMVMLKADLYASGISPFSNGEGKNWQQYFALQQLLNPAIKAVFLVGGAGSGKTLLALAAGLEQKNHKNNGTYSYKYLRIARPPEFVGKDHGYLPGDLEEKLHPWNYPFIQSLEFIDKKLRDKTTNLKKYSSVLWSNTFGSDDFTFESVPLCYIQGNTFHDTFLIVDEAQNLSEHQIKVIMTRVGENSKVIFTGDPEQIENHLLTPETSGLMVAIHKLKGNRLVSYTILNHLVRSEISKIATKLI